MFYMCCANLGFLGAPNSDSTAEVAHSAKHGGPHQAARLADFFWFLVSAHLDTSWTLLSKNPPLCFLVSQKSIYANAGVRICVSCELVECMELPWE